jgi:hypothetical protein
LIDIFKGTVQYGLIAEEVAKVSLEPVIRDEHGGIDGVRYDERAGAVTETSSNILTVAGEGTTTVSNPNVKVNGVVGAKISAP